VPHDIQVDRNLCMGSGQCLMYAPGTFDLDEDSISTVVDPQGDSAADIQVAVDSCPTHAISLTVHSA
jgi:ferredoxin